MPSLKKTASKVSISSPCRGPGIEPPRSFCQRRRPLSVTGPQPLVNTSAGADRCPRLRSAAVIGAWPVSETNPRSFSSWGATFRNRRMLLCVKENHPAAAFGDELRRASLDGPFHGLRQEGGGYLDGVEGNVARSSQC
jgi:hypothetical protein